MLKQIYSVKIHNIKKDQSLKSIVFAFCNGVGSFSRDFCEKWHTFMRLNNRRLLNKAPDA